jgi:hypothetical protein
MKTQGFADTVLGFKNTEKAMDYLRKLDADSAEREIPEFIFVSLELELHGGFSFVSDFKKLSKKIKHTSNLVILEESSVSFALPKINSDPYVFATIHKPVIKMNLDYLESINTPSRKNKQFK